MRIYPVIHASADSLRIAKECRRAISAEADGVYITDKYTSTVKQFFETYRQVRETVGDEYIGIHLFKCRPLEAVKAVSRSVKNLGVKIPDALMIDDMRAYDMVKLDESERQIRVVDGVEQVIRFRGKSQEAIEYKNGSPAIRTLRILGGIAYKHSDFYTADPDLAAYETALLVDSVDAVLASGPSSGAMPPKEKILAMKAAAEGKPVVVEVAAEPADIKGFQGVIDEMIISSGLETTPGSGKFDLEYLEELTRAAHNLAV